MTWGFLFFIGILSACVGPSELGVNAPPLSSKVPDVLEPIDQTSSEMFSPPSAGYEQLMSFLASLGYQGVGFEHEDSQTLQYVERVFREPQTHGRRIDRIYTGLKLSYDAEQKSLTLGEGMSVEATVLFIKTKVPSQN